MHSIYDCQSQSKSLSSEEHCIWDEKNFTQFVFKYLESILNSETTIVNDIIHKLSRTREIFVTTSPNARESISTVTAEKYNPLNELMTETRPEKYVNVKNMTIIIVHN